MGRLIEEQAVIECLTNTAKYYEREDADEWTKGIHYGLLHGVDNILDDVPTVEAIPKDQYEARLKADLKAILVELQSEIHELENPYPHDYDNLLPLAQHNAFYDAKSTIEDLVDEKINSLKAGSEPQESEVDNGNDKS